MRRSLELVLVFALAFALALALGASSRARAGGASGPVALLSGRVAGASGRHPVRVALWAQTGFLTQPFEQLTFLPGVDLKFQFKVAPGRWAVSAFEDVNGNGELDMGAFGPKEPHGFWRPFHAWRKPRFEDVAVLIKTDVADADVTLK